MENKLQELTERLYKEGLAKGKEEGEAILASAREQAGEIISSARKEAGEIISKAKAEAEEYRTRVEGDVKMASSQALQGVKKDIENLIVEKAAGEHVGKVLAEEDFIKGIITAVAERFSSLEPKGLSLVLPESLKDGLEPFIRESLAKTAGGDGAEVSFSKKISGGFHIGPRDGSYFVSFSDDTFRELIGEYMRPATKKILFGE